MKLFRRLRRPSAASPIPTAQDDPAPVVLTRKDREKFELLLTLVNDKSQPNINALMTRLRDLDALALNVKALGYDLARRLGEALPVREHTRALHVGLTSKLSTQADLESEWAAHWLAELKIPLFLHRKLWEFAFVLQALHERDLLVPGRRAVGFGCGMEPMASYFAAKGIESVTTDLPPDDARSLGWMRNNEYAPTPEQSRQAHLVDAETFARNVRHRYVDMNDIPRDLVDFDFCWSICAFEHLGSIARGLAFVERSIDCLRPGGVAVHTTEFNINPEGPTVDNWVTVFFQRKHMEELAERLRKQGHRVEPFDFDIGDKPLDRFVDLPPWHDGKLGKVVEQFGQPHHLKVAADGFILTCIGLIVTKAA